MAEQQFEQTLDTLDQRLGALTEAVSEYERRYREHGTSETPAGARAGIEMEPIDVDMPSVQPGDSIFDAILEQIVQGLHSFLTQDTGVPRFDALLSAAPDIVCALDAEARVLSVNPVFTQYLGYAPHLIVGCHFPDILLAGSEESIRLRCRDLIEAGASKRVTRPDDILMLRVKRTDNTLISLECVTTTSARGGVPALVAAFRDPSIHRSLVQQLRETKDNYDALSESLTEAIIRIDETFAVVFANRAVQTTFGFEPAELQGKPFSTLFPGEIYRRHEQEFRKYFVVDDTDRRRLRLPGTLEILGRHKNRGITPMEISFGNSKEYRGRTLTCIIRDITQRKSAERRLRQLAYHDQLTGLGNRDLFDGDVRRLFETPGLFETGMAALLFLDLDGFKQVNDTMGHDAGDRLLIDTAMRLRRTLRESDSVYRFGGDEFVVLLSFVHSKRDAALVANNILGEVRTPYELSGSADSINQTATVGVSIGIAMIPEHGRTIEAITKAADLAMYHAKELGKNRFEFYHAQLDARAKERWEMEQGVRSALARGEFVLHYQPIVEADGTVRGLEALVRWNHPEQGQIPPARFIPIAEETGLIIPLGNWVMETAFRDLRAWNDGGHPELYMAVNLSPRQFDQEALVDAVSGAVTRTGVKTQNVKLEITESCIMSAPQSAIDKMNELKKRHPGLSISIDDFGTGYSSLSYLSQLPADTIKIDLSFVKNLFAVNNQKVVKAIINLAHSMNLDIVAEGVESKEQWDYFSNQHCRSLQGFHFGRAAGRDEITSLLTGGKLPVQQC